MSLILFSYLKKGKTMSCNVCYANLMGLSMINSSPSTMCDTHYFDWQQEKMYNELEMSTEGMYI